jgi:hypothetical protein
MICDSVEMGEIGIIFVAYFGMYISVKYELGFLYVSGVGF